MPSTRSLSFFIVVPLLAMALVASGCGVKAKSSWVGEPASLFELTKTKVGDVKSMRISGDMDVRFQMAGMDTVMKTEYDGRFKRTQESGLVGSMKLNTRMESAEGDTGPSTEIQVYTEGNKIYAQVAGQDRWVYRELNPGEMMGGIAQDPLSVNPQGIMMTFQVAKSLELVEETEGYAVFSFSLDAEKLVNDEVLSKFKEGLEQFGSAELGDEEVKRALVETIELFKFTIKVDRESQLPLELTQETTGNLLEVMGRFLPQTGTTEGGSIEMRMNVRFSDYGADFQVERPQDIEKATPM